MRSLRYMNLSIQNPAFGGFDTGSTHKWNLKDPQDIDGNWFISEQEVEQCTAAGFEWVKSLRPAPYVPKPSPPFPGLS